MTPIAFLQEPATGHCPEVNESSHHSHTLSP
jgi:hypothetical protein